MHEIKILCECGEEMQIPEDWFETRVAFHFWENHGHFPDLATFICKCGASQSTGPSEGLGPEEQGQVDMRFIREHSEPWTGAFDEQR